jgi:hypothetical protein
MSLTKISLAENNLIIPARENLVKSRLGMRKFDNLFSQCLELLCRPDSLDLNCSIEDGKRMTCSWSSGHEQVKIGRGIRKGWRPV